MEIIRISENCLKIKSRGASFVVDPSGKTDADVIIWTPNMDVSGALQTVKLVIEGPGEYEVGGVMVRAKQVAEDIVYEIDDETDKILLLPSTAVSRVEGDEKFSAIVIKIIEDIDESVESRFPSATLVFYGDDSHLKLSPESIIKTSKLNLRKKEELDGKIVFLTYGKS